ncbi:hypothetical protein SteCoe_13257 [Stentor coeruleus]|uniref:J domain-containing protein n=1 Tax=Stentor coeruleus TaxID=5963 RepID=A0A1R2C8S7_9CILI|nr:hypothetical protein SteCoe_13257 [Stentor coeruleus]
MSQDEYASSIFVTSILGIVLIPVLYCFLKDLKSHSKLCIFISLVFIGILLSGFIYSIGSIVSSEKPQQPFDPYEILSLSHTSTEKEVKTAFRELSKKYHPDKNPDYQDYYILITKAYKTLTDPEAKFNYEKYGNPDGPTGFRLSFGLPKFLFKQENQIPILLGFLLIIVIVPCGIVMWMRGGGELDKNGVSQQNLPIYISLVHDSLNYKQLLYMISLSVEFRNLRISKEQEAELNMLNETRQYTAFIPKGKQVSPQMIKVIFLLLAHLDHVEISESLKKDQLKILETTLKIITTVIESAFFINIMPKGKKISPNTFNLLLDFSRRLVHKLQFQLPVVAMVPDLDEYNTLKRIDQIQDLKKILEQPKPSVKILQNDAEKIKEFIKKVPQYEINAKIYVEGEDDYRLGDVATIKVEVLRKFDEERKRDKDLVQTADLGFEKRERIWVVISDGKRVFAVKVLQAFDDKVEDSGIKIILDRKLGFATGKQSLEIEVKSDSYLGVDISTNLTFTVNNPPKTS